MVEIGITISVNADIQHITAEGYMDHLLDSIRFEIEQRGWPAPDLMAKLTFPSLPAPLLTRRQPLHKVSI